jgi:Clp amino terminal domain, pathogenicity island component
MFERFTERARQVVVLAQEEARALKHNYIGTEHILLGLLREEGGLAARVLESLEITVDRVRTQVRRIVGSGDEVTSGQIPFTPRAKKVLELALREALSLGHDYIGTEHILLGLVRENEGVAARILLDFDADSEKIRNEVIHILSEPGLRHPATSEPMTATVVELSAAVDELPATDTHADLGWRGRPVALAALGAAVLARTAFDRSKTGTLEPLEMQLLARLTLGPADDPLAEAGELFESLTVALACDRDDLRDVIHVLGERRLILSVPEQDDDERISITADGVSVVHQWLPRVIPLFGQWPPDHAAVDDAIS